MNGIKLGDCSICMDVIRASSTAVLDRGARPTTLTCGHVFHIACVSQLVQRQTIHRSRAGETCHSWLVCPVCRLHQMSELRPMITHADTFIESGSQVNVRVMYEESKRHADKMKTLINAMEKKTLEPITCRECGSGFNTSTEYSDHYKRSHQSPPEIECHRCTLTFKNSREFTRHYAAKHRDLECDACGELLDGLEEYRLHYQNNHQTYTCNHCPTKLYTSLQDVVDHMRKDHAETYSYNRGHERYHDNRIALDNPAAAAFQPKDMWSCEYCVGLFETEVEVRCHALENHTTQWDGWYMCDALSCNQGEGFSSRGALCRHFLECHVTKHE